MGYSVSLIRVQGRQREGGRGGRREEKEEEREGGRREGKKEEMEGGRRERKEGGGQYSVEAQQDSNRQPYRTQREGGMERGRTI